MYNHPLLRNKKPKQKQSTYKKEKTNKLTANIPVRKGDDPKSVEINKLWDEIPFDHFINKSTLFYGNSGSGKTIFIYDLMFKLRKHFDSVIVYAPSNEEKHDFDEVVPIPLINEHLTLEHISTVYDMQRAKASTYNIANNLDNLLSTFTKIARSEEKQQMAAIANERNMSLHKISNMQDILKKKEYKKKITTKFEETAKKLCKQTILKYRNNLRGIKLTEDERKCVKYVKLNPRILIIFDDAMDEIKEIINEGKKKNNNVVEKFFFKGRHAYITHFYAFQDETKLSPALRNNAHISVFTEGVIANSFYQKLFKKGQRLKEAETVVNKIFDN